MFSVTRMSGKLYAMKTVDTFDEFYYDDEALNKVQPLIDQGTPVIFCEELADLNTLLTNPENIEIVEPE